MISVGTRDFRASLETLLHAKDIFQKVIREKVRRQLKALDPEVNINEVIRKDEPVEKWAQKVQLYATEKRRMASTSGAKDKRSAIEAKAN